MSATRANPAFTHRGWLGLCPVYVGALDTVAPMLGPRHPWLEWWLNTNAWVLGAAAVVWSMVDEAYDPDWPIRVTGALTDDER